VAVCGDSVSGDSGVSSGDDGDSPSGVRGDRGVSGNSGDSGDSGDRWYCLRSSCHQPIKCSALTAKRQRQKTPVANILYLTSCHYTFLLSLYSASTVSKFKLLLCIP
jgi:hypothetical protein